MSFAVLVKNGGILMLGAILAGLGSSAISALSSFGNSAMSYAMNKKMARLNAELQLKNQQKLMDKQYSQNQQSLLDSPSATRSGLERAGYNPILAVSDATYSPSVGLGSAGMPSANGDYGFGDVGAAFDRGSTSAVQRKLQEKEIKKIDKLSDAELSKLEAEADAALAHSGAAMYNAETNRLEANARIEKIKKEADSINPEIRRHNERYGNSPLGRIINDFSRIAHDSLGFNGSDSSLSSPSSAKGVKVISDELNRVEKRRGDAVRKRRARH